MRIVFQNKTQKERRLYMPNALLLNHLTSFLIARGLEKRGIHLSCKQIRMIAESIKAVHKRHSDWVLVEIEDVNGDEFKIIL